MTYKNNYTKEEINELKQWFIDHQAQLPATFQMDATAHIQDIKHTVQALLAILENMDPAKTVFSGEIYFFGRLRDALIAAGFGK